KKYWRSLGELSDTPEFREWLEREFPAGAAQLEGDEWSRRDFLKLMGASMALAGVGLTSCRGPEGHLVPFTKSVEWTIPGKPLFYATAMPRRTGAIPLVVTTHGGGPTKLDGNPLHPASGGATDAFAQASILDLYDPARSQRFVQRGKKSDRAAFESHITQLRKTLLVQQGDSLAFLVEETHSPTRERLRAELEKIFPRLRCPASQIATFAYALAGKILAATKDANLGSVIGTLKVPGGSATFDQQWLSEAANDLVAKPGASLVLAGPNQPVVVQLVVYAI